MKLEEYVMTAAKLLLTDDGVIRNPNFYVE
jgi:hypothetical protein